MQKFVRENREHVVGGLMFLWNLRQNFWWRVAVVSVAAFLAYIVYFSSGHHPENGTKSSPTTLPYAQNPSVISKEGSPTALLSVEVREKASIAREKAAREMLLESIAHTRSALEARRQAREAQRQQHVALVTQLQEIEALRNELQRDREMIRRLNMQMEQREAFLNARWEDLKKQLQQLEARERTTDKDIETLETQLQQRLAMLEATSLDGTSGSSSSASEMTTTPNPNTNSQPLLYS